MGRRGRERDDDADDGRNDKEGRDTAVLGSDVDVDLLETGVKQDESSADVVGLLRTNVLDGEAGGVLEEGDVDAHVDGG